MYRFSYGIYNQEGSTFLEAGLLSIIDVTLTLATRDLPFREHRMTYNDDEDTVGGNNFLSIINLLTR